MCERDLGGRCFSEDSLIYATTLRYDLGGSTKHLEYVSNRRERGVSWMIDIESDLRVGVFKEGNGFGERTRLLLNMDGFDGLVACYVDGDLKELKVPLSMLMMLSEDELMAEDGEALLFDEDDDVVLCVDVKNKSVLVENGYMVEEVGYQIANDEHFTDEKWWRGCVAKRGKTISVDIRYRSGVMELGIEEKLGGFSFLGCRMYVDTTLNMELDDIKSLGSARNFLHHQISVG